MTILVALSGDVTVEKLGEQIVRFLGDHLGARAVVFFIRDGERFVRVATHGVPADAQVPVEVSQGNGLWALCIIRARIHGRRGRYLIGKVRPHYRCSGSIHRLPKAAVLSSLGRRQSRGRKTTVR